jgi:hypothetical protein
MLGGLQTVTIFMQVENGRGKHAKELHVEHFNEMLKVYFVLHYHDGMRS